MKHLFVLLIVCSGMHAHAQSSYSFGFPDVRGAHEFSFSAGLLSGRQIIISLGAEDGPTWHKATPAYCLSYRYFLLRWLSLGVTVSTQTIWGDNYADMASNYPYNFKLTNTIIAFEPLFYPFSTNDEMLQPYARLGLGASFSEEIDRPKTGRMQTTLQESMFSFQFTPIGLRYGRALAGFAELGIGYRGILSGGLCYRFPEKKRQTAKNSD